MGVVVSSDETKVILASSVHPGQAIITMNSGLSENINRTDREYRKPNLP